MNVMKYLSLFSGIGGFEYGLEQSKYPFECVGYSEIDKYAKSIYQRKYPDHIDLGDATEINAKELPDFDLLVGGFPCQAFSISGKRKGFDDTRGTMFFEIARILQEKKPRYFLLENVKGLLSHNKGSTFKKILGVLAELGYDVEWQVYNSKCFNTSQNRERLYIKGYSRRLCGGEILSVERECREAHIQIDTVKSNSQANSIKSIDGCSSALCGLGGGQGGKTGLYKVENGKVSNKYWGSRTGRIHRTDELMNTLTCTGQNSGGRQIIIDDRIFSKVEINTVGNLSNTGHDGDNVLGDDGLSSCLTASNYKHPLRVKIDVENIPNNIKNNMNPVDDTRMATTTTTGEMLCLKCSQPQVPLDKKLTNYVLENHIKLKTNTRKGYDEVNDGDGVRLCHPNTKSARGRSQKNMTGALSTTNDWGTLDKDYRIRRLTPRECERLQAFPDDYTKYGVDGELISDTQRYKCLGNAVTTTVVTHIADTMFGGYFEDRVNES